MSFACRNVQDLVDLTRQQIRPAISMRLAQLGICILEGRARTMIGSLS